MRRLMLLATLLLVAACQPAATPLPDDAAPSPTPGVATSQLPTTEPIPSDELGEFTCELPITGTATDPVTANYTDVRVGTHDGYDRVVIEFADGVPEMSLERAEPPFLQDASGIPLDVQGDSVLKLIMRNATALTESGEISYDGPRDFDPGFPQLVDVLAGGDFEAMTTWYIGLNDEACVRAFALSDPDRLVIDVEH
jgi:hypothetical protein